MLIDMGGPTPAAERRRRWASNLTDTLRLQDRTPKQFRIALAEHGLEVSMQCVYQWLRGDTAPSPESQAVIARTLGQPPAVLFPVEAAS